MAQGVFVITEQREGLFRKVSYEAVSEGRRIADDLASEVTAVVLGSGIEGLAGELGKYGADKVFVADDPLLADYTTDAYTNVLADLIKTLDPAVILLGATVQGKDLSGRLAARLDAGVAMDCVAVKLNNGQLTYTRPMFGGKILADVEIEGFPQIVAIRPNVMEIRETPKEGVAQKPAIQVGELKTAGLEKILDTGDKVELTEADIVVSGGRGTGGNFPALEQ
jgi:electron transfer flavoprotein alpha subunit